MRSFMWKDQVEEFIRQAQNVDIESPKLTVGDRMNYAKNQVISTVKKVAPYIFIGVAIGAAIHNLIPEHMVRSILGEQKWYAVPLATVVGVPMYADIFGTIPVAESLLAKGAGLGINPGIYDVCDDYFVPITGDVVKSN